MLAVGDQFVVGVFELHLGDGRIETLDERNARFRQRRHCHQRGALCQLAAAIVGFQFAGVVGDLSHSDAKRVLRGIICEAAQCVGVGCFVRDDRRIADRGGVTARAVRRGADTARSGDRDKPENQGHR